MGDAEYLSAAEAAARLGVSLRTVRRRIADRSLPSVRIGGTVRIPAAALDLPITAATRKQVSDAVAPYEDDPDRERAAYVARWNASHWPDTWERMLERRRRAFDRLDAIRATTKPSTGPHDTVDAILDAADQEWDERLAASIQPPSGETAR